MLRSLDKGHCILLVMLDLSAAFDTVDQELALLLHRFEACFGIRSEAKEWLKSYFNNRQQVVRIKGVNSDPRGLGTGIPQGSVIGPFSFPLYTSPLFKIVDNHQCNIHMYLARKYTCHSSLKTVRTYVPKWKHVLQMSDVGWRIITWKLMIIRQSFLSSLSSPCRIK